MDGSMKPGADNKGLARSAGALAGIAAAWLAEPADREARREG